MPWNTRLIFWLALTVLGLVSPARAGDAPAASRADIRGSLQSAYNQADSAFYLRDLNATLAPYAPDVVVVGSKANLDTVRHLTKYLLATCNSVNRTSEVIDAALADASGASAIVTVEHHFCGARPNPQTSADDTLVITSTDRDFWSKTESGWLLKRQKNLASKVYINGQAFTGMLDSQPEVATKYNLSGVWNVDSSVSGQYMVRINQYSNSVVSTKMTGTRFVPAGYVNFFATYVGDTFMCHRLIAAADHTQAAYLPATVTIIGTDDFQVSDPDRGTTSYHRAK